MYGIILLVPPYTDIVGTMRTENEYVSMHILSLKFVIRSMGYEIVLGIPLNPITPKRHFEHISLFMQN
jgi:hypothetical protein